jgi:hypothetical protein
MQFLTKYKSLSMLLGFLMIVFGFTGILLQMVGVQWAFLAFLERISLLFAFVVKVLMIMCGFVLFILARTDWDAERRKSS